MRLRYTKHDGTPAEFQLGDRPITIGRNPDSDIILIDEKVSRIHCGLRLWDGEYYLKDLKSRNGTFVNNHRVEVATLKPGDQLRIGSIEVFFEGDTGPTTALHEIKGEMESGKGYSTILREIVDDSPATPAPPAPANPAKPTFKLPAKKGTKFVLKKKA